MISPADVKSYTSFDAVKERAEEQIEFDIIQAQSDIFSFCGHNFSDEKYQDLPKEVKLAFIKLSEYYALINNDESILKGYNSEKIGDYQYTLKDGDTKTISLNSLLEGHRTKKSKFRLKAF